MKAFFKNIFIFFIPFLLIVVFLEIKLSHITSSYNYKRSCLENKLDSIEVLVLGSSQMLQGIDPSCFNLYGYNLANVSQTLFYDTRLALKYIDRMPKLRYVIIGISYTSLGEQLYDGIENWRDFFYCQYWDIRFPETNKYDLRNFSKTFLYGPQTVLSFSKEKFNPHLISGYEENGFLRKDSFTNNPNISDSSGWDRVKHHDTEFKLNRINENTDDLALLLKILTEKNITPLLLSPPLYPTYIKYRKRQTILTTSRTIDSLCHTYHCHYFDYTNIKGFEKIDFYDNDHLNFLGAHKLSEQINKELLHSNDSVLQKSK